MFNKDTYEAMRSIEWVPGGSLRQAPWRTTYIIKTDLEVLARSMEDYGWLQPIIVQKSTNTIIDGNYRWEIASHISKLTRDTKKHVPVFYVDCDDVDAMLMHVRLNRGRGTTLAKRVSRIVQAIFRSRKYSESYVKRVMVMHGDEIDLMIDGTLLKDKNISSHKYSPAWVPVEAPASATKQAIAIERPPNKDN